MPTKIAKIRVSRGLETDLPFGWVTGRLYVTSDTRKIFAGQGINLPLVEVGGSAISFRGTWLVGSTYVTNDFVTFNNSLYIALQNSTGSQPDLSPSDWELILNGSTDTFFFT